MANEFKIKNGLVSDGNIVVTGSITATGGISISGSIASAETASFAPSYTLSSSFNSYTSSASSSVGSLSSSVATTTSGLSSSIGSLSGSIATTTSGLASRIGSVETKTGSYATTGSNIFVGSQVITGSLYITNDMVVQGCSCLQNITASAVSIGTNVVMLNTATPAVRFAGVSVQDSGSNAGVTGSIYWDGLCNRWVYSNPSGIGYSGGMLLSGPRTSTLGTESPLTCNAIAKSGGGDHLYDSVIFESGSNIGIGTSTPASTLEVNGTIRSLSYGGSVYPYAGCFLGLADASGAILGAGSTNGYAASICVFGGGFATPNLITLSTASSERMRIGSDGTKYFGTYNGSRIQVSASGENLYQYTNGYYIYGLFNDANSLSIESAFAGCIIFRTAAQTTSSSPTTATERMRITHVGISCFACQVCAPYVSTKTIEMGGGASSPSTACVGYGMFGYSGVGLGIAAGATGANQGMGFFTCGNYERMRLISNGDLLFYNSAGNPSMCISQTGSNTLGALSSNLILYSTGYNVYIRPATGYETIIDSGNGLNVTGKVYSKSGSGNINPSYTSLFTLEGFSTYLVIFHTGTGDGTYGIHSVIYDSGDQVTTILSGNNISSQLIGADFQIKSNNGSTYGLTWTALRIK